MREANTDTTYCVNTNCNKCWRHISNWKFNPNENYIFTSGIENCEELKGE